MADDVRVEIKGLDELRAVLLGLPAKLRKRALRNALAAGARIVRDAAKRGTPTLKASTYAGSSAIKRGIRKPGTVRDAISVRTSKADRRDGNVGVFVNVRPAKAGQRGAKNPNDPFYWRFIEFDTVKRAGSKFLRDAAGKLPEALRKFEQTIGPQLDKLNKTPKADI